MDTLDEDDEPPRQLQEAEPQEEESLAIGWEAYFDYRKSIKNAQNEEFTYYQKGQEYKNVALVCVHGAGFSGLSFAQFAKAMAVDGLVIALDMRGHGLSTQNGELSFQQLTDDLNELIPAILTENAPSVQKYNVVLIGHSLGGSLITSVAAPQLNILCLIQLDITEMTALASLPNMQAILQRRPRRYRSQAEFVQSFIRQRTLQNKKSLLIQLNGIINEKNELRADLSASAPHWRGWFEGMNARFLASPAWKVLLVSTLEKLDRDHEIAMMQGRIAVEVIPGCIHNLHEDNPEKVVSVIQEHLRRVHFTDPLYDQPMDFKRGLTDTERPDPLELIKRNCE